MIDYDYLYDKTIFEKAIGGDFHAKQKLSFSKYTDKCINPKKEYEYWFKKNGYKNDAYFCEQDNVEDNYIVSNETVIYLGELLPVWGHHITDNLRRIWFLFSDEYKKLQNCKIVYSMYNEKYLPLEFCCLLEKLGIDGTKFVCLHENIRYQTIILPDNCFYIDRSAGAYYFTDEYVELIDRIRAYYNKVKVPTGFDKVYFTYARYGNKSPMGEDRIETYFKNHGYTIIAPEENTVDENMNILTNCKVFASTIGSCSHNSVFLNEGTEVILIPRGNFLTGYQIAIDQVHNLNVTYIDSCLSIFTNSKYPWRGPFLCCVSDNLQRFFGEMKASDDFYLWNYKYIIPYLLKGIKEYDRDYGTMPSVYYREFFIALKRYFSAVTGYSKLYSEPREKLLNFLMKNKDKKIYVYGCGKYGIKTKRFLCNMGFEVEAFIVSDGYKNEDEVNRIPIYEISQIDKDSLILVAVNKLLQKEILEVLNNKGYMNFFVVYK